VSPDQDSSVIITDADLRSAYRFLIICATVLQEFIIDFGANPGAEINPKAYLKKLKKYEPTIEAMMEDYEDGIFG